MAQGAVMNALRRCRGVGLQDSVMFQRECLISVNAGRKLASFHSSLNSTIGSRQQSQNDELRQCRYYSKSFSSSNSKGPESTPPQPPPRIPSSRIRLQQQRMEGARRGTSNDDVDHGRGSRLVSLVYVHPLSQIVLLHFQTYHHEWIRRHNLDQRLFIHRDGTFLIESNHSHYQSVVRLWTYYNTEERTHWLAMSTRQAMRRVVLQENSMIVWNKHRSSIEERVKDSIRELMDLIDENI